MTSGVGILRDPGYWNWDFGLSKDLYVDNRGYFTFRVEAFNVLNHPNWGCAGPRTSGPRHVREAFTNTFYAPRIVELVVKFTY